MHLKRIIAATAALASLSLITACEDADADSATAGVGAGAGAGADTLEQAQAYVQRYASCERMSTDPKDGRLPLTEFTAVGKWSVTELGVCSDRVERGEIMFYMFSDLKSFQEGYEQRVQAKIAAGDSDYGLMSRVLVGKNFAVTPTETKTALKLSRSDLRVLTCNPTASVPEGYKREKGLVEGCVLSDFVASDDGEGSPNFETPQDPAAEGGSTEPSQSPAKSLGLPRAGSLAELKRLVHPHTVDCTSYSTDPAALAVESIDYQPVITGAQLLWGVGDRAICGEAGGAQRAHNLNWLDMVSDMELLQTRAKAAQQEDLKDDNRLQATASRLVVGENIAVETNDPIVRGGLYQLQFLYLNCEPGFSAPAGYRVEQASVEGCVLTNYEPGVEVGGN
ncbi:hypothetical protein [Streptomyces resistomycificus]|uniref:hypothetical protein n=1 Tax=Streptomyces resistomycificus TaxID=67356 RepID=UPI0004AA1A93|nr:hypothetical protein [Streptomyces resistomycificus]KUN91512.1 hypothetical protein AQJ84_36205 [Streptomyces resistomycificus]